MACSPLDTIHNYLQLSDRVGTSGQPQQEQFAAIKEAGFAVVVNLLPDTQTLAGEEELVRSLGMDYIQIPVWWDAPEIADFERFCEVMEANRETQVFVHCAANMRASAFMYLYRVLYEAMPAAEATRDLHRIWAPNPIWHRFINRVMALSPSAQGA
jgi:protein tyrosine phosphatase (PTP) superfamily phosphohydrolase (DUF442 family)